MLVTYLNVETDENDHKPSKFYSDEYHISRNIHIIEASPDANFIFVRHNPDPDCLCKLNIVQRLEILTVKIADIIKL
jgi:hypothetical protein